MSCTQIKCSSFFYNRSIWNRAFIWLKRFRKRKGYSIQSPWAFSYARYIILGKDQYYAFCSLKGLYDKVQSNKLPRKRYELLFRLANNMQAKECALLGGSGELEMAYLKAARSRIVLRDFTPNSFFTSPSESCLFLVNTEYLTLEEAQKNISFILNHADEKDILVISGLQRSKALRLFWKSITQHPKARSSFDLYEAGIVCFNSLYPQMCYLINY